MKRQRLDTRIHLVEELEKLPQTPGIIEMISEAKAGEYHDFKNNKYACGKVESSRRLRSLGHIELAKRIENGEFDESPDEEDNKELAALLADLAKPKVAYGPKTSIRGTIMKSPKGFYWYVEVSIEGLDQEHIAIDSSKEDKYFAKKKDAEADLDKAGKHMAELLQDQWKKMGASFCEVIDRTKEN